MSDRPADISGPLAAGKSPGPALVPVDPAWSLVQMKACEPITANAALIVAYQAASSPHSIRAHKSDVEAFYT